MSCPYYTFKCNDYYCMKKQDYVNDDLYHSYCKGYSYDECAIYKNESTSNGCYLSSACYVAMNRCDNCDELNILRKFRDTYMTSEDALKKDVKEYYEVAPKIVNCINAQHNYKEIYQYIYDNMVCPCVSYIKKQKFRDAYLTYKKIYYILKDKYYKHN